MNKINIKNHPAITLSLWIFIATIVMIFAGFTSALIVREGQGNWQNFNLPVLFNYNTVILILSSITLQWALISVKNQQYRKMKYALLLTLVFGLLFAFGQLLAWNQLNKAGIFLSGNNVSSSFLYLISGVHLFHIVGAIFFLSFITYKGWTNKYDTHSYFGIKTCAIFWHFLDVLWIYLFVFFKYYISV